MEGGGGRNHPPKPAKFSVYQNPALSTAMTTNSLRPKTSTFLFIISVSSASAVFLLAIILREVDIVDGSRDGYFSQDVSYMFFKVVQAVMALVLIGSIFALLKAISLWKVRAATAASASNGTKEQLNLTKRQLGLLGMKPNLEQVAPKSLEQSKPKALTSPSDMLVPLHQPITGSGRVNRISGEKSNVGSGNKMRSFSTPSRSPASPSLYLVPSQSPTMQMSPGPEQIVSTPWSSKRTSSPKEILTENQLELFLADFEEKFSASAGKVATPPPTISGFGIATPSTIGASAGTSGATRSTPLRPVRMSPGSQKFSTPPKKGEGDLPPPMSMDVSIDAFERLGVYPQIEEWRDRLRQWFSSVLLNPLLVKIETSHIKVMEAAAKLGVSIKISQVGSDSSAGTTATASERNNNWQPSYTMDEEGLLVQLRTTLVQTLDASMSRLPLNGLQMAAQNPSIPVMQECIDLITEHQKLLALVKGEWAKGLLPQSSIRADYTVQRIRELAVGTCVKNFEYVGNGDKLDKKWTQLPTDSHLLLYLFCAFLEHPKWMLHVDPTYSGVQSSKNPLFLGVLPPKERFPEKYLAVISGVPAVLHPGACVLAVGKQNPSIFALYWDKKAQFSLEGRTALWDSILLLCHRIKTDYGGIVRGMHLASSALGILPVLDTENNG